MYLKYTSTFMEFIENIYLCQILLYPKTSISKVNIYIFIAVALDESIFLDVLHFPMKNIKSRGLEATPMGGLTSKLIQ